LIAINVNNYNEKQKHEVKITEALNIIHRELSEDIKEANETIEFYRLKDTLINFIMTNELSEKDFLGDKRMDYASVGSNVSDMIINTNGFELLMANSEKAPRKYQGLLESLKEVYESDKEYLERSNNNLDEIVKDYLSYLDKNKEWSHQLLYFKKIDDSAIDFYLNDAAYKNHMASYQSSAISNFYADLHNFRIHAEDVYDRLTDLLQLRDAIASDSTYYSYNSQDYLHFLGTYKDSTNTAIISMDAHKLFYQYNDDIKEYLIPINKQSFIIRFDNTFNDFKQDSTGRITHCNWHHGRSKISMKKIE